VANLVRWKQSGVVAVKLSQCRTVNDCITRFPGGLTTLHLADEAAVHWLGASCKSWLLFIGLALPGKANKFKYLYIY